MSEDRQLDEAVYSRDPAVTLVLAGSLTAQKRASTDDPPPRRNHVQKPQAPGEPQASESTGRAGWTMRKP